MTDDPTQKMFINYMSLVHNPCPACYKTGLIVEGARNRCSQCGKTWCHMCRLILTDRKFMGYMDRIWSHGFFMYFMGPTTCQVFHFCRFATCKGVRSKRPDSVWWLLSSFVIILWPVFSLLLNYALVLDWSMRATCGLTFKKSPYLLIFAPFLFIVLMVLSLAASLLYWMLIVPYFQMWMVYSAWCFYSNAPLERGKIDIDMGIFSAHTSKMQNMQMMDMLELRSKSCKEQQDRNEQEINALAKNIAILDAEL